MPKKDQMLPLSPKKLSQAEAAMAIACYISKKVERCVLLCRC